MEEIKLGGVTLLIIIKIRMYMDRTVPYTNMVELFKHRAVPRSQKKVGA